MHCEGSPEVLVNIARKKLRRAEGMRRNDTYRAMLWIGGGGNRGVYGASRVLALEEAGYTQTFDIAGGASTGKPTIDYFVAGQVPVGLSIYLEECTTKRFISPRRMLGGGNLVDLDWLDEQFRFSKKKLDQGAIYASPTACIGSVTDARTGRGIILDAKNVQPDILTLTRASIAIPGSSREVEVAGISALDGAVAANIPFRELIERYRPTDLLVFMNRHQQYREDGWLRGLGELFLLRQNVLLPVLETLAKQQEMFECELAYLRGQKECRWLLFWEDAQLGALTRNPARLRAASERAYRHMKECLTQAEAFVSA